MCVTGQDVRKKGYNKNVMRKNNSSGTELSTVNFLPAPRRLSAHVIRVYIQDICSHRILKILYIGKTVVVFGPVRIRRTGTYRNQ